MRKPYRFNYTDLSEDESNESDLNAVDAQITFTHKHLIGGILAIILFLGISQIYNNAPSITGAITITQNGILDCTFRSSGVCLGGETKIYGLANMTNSHVELSNESNYGISLCCTDTFGGTTIGTSSLGEESIGLVTSTNAHAELNNETVYNLSAFISTSLGIISCRNNATGLGSCAVNETCVGTLSSSTNAHVSNCTASVAYNNTVCCGFGSLTTFFVPPNTTQAAALTANGSVNGTLIGGDPTYPTQTITYINITSGKKFFEVNGTFNVTNVSNADLTIQSNSSAIAVNTTGLVGSGIVHALYLKEESLVNLGPRVCPVATILSEVVDGCAGELEFFGPYPQTLSGVRVTQTTDEFRIGGLSSSGAMIMFNVASNTTGSNLTNTTTLNSTVLNSNKTNSDIRFSFINVSTNMNCTVINSTEINSTCLNSVMMNATTTNSNLTNLTTNNSVITNDVCSEGTITFGGITYTCPTTLSEIYAGGVVSSCPATITINSTLETNLSATAGCITFGNSNIELDCAGFEINYSTVSSGNAIHATNKTNLAVRNCLIIQDSASGSSRGISFTNVNLSTITNNTISTNGTTSNTILVDSSNSNNFMDMTLDAKDSPAISVVASSNSNIFDKLVINTPIFAASNAGGLEFDNSSNNVIANTTIRTERIAIYFVTGSEFNTLKNISATSLMSSALDIRAASSNNMVSDSLFDSAPSVAMNISSNDTIVRNNRANSTTNIALSIGGGFANITVINNTLISTTSQALAYGSIFGVVANNRIQGVSGMLFETGAASTLVLNNSITATTGSAISSEANSMTYSNNQINSSSVLGAIRELGNLSIYFNNTINHTGTIPSDTAIRVASASGTIFNFTTLTTDSTWLTTSGALSSNNMRATLFNIAEGSIFYEGNLSLVSGSNVSLADLNVSNIIAFVNSTEHPFLNTSAQVTIRNIPFLDSRPIVDFEDDGSFVSCDPPQCVEVTFGGTTKTFNVSSFTSYSVIERPLIYNFTKLDSVDPVASDANLTYQLILNVTEGTAINATVTDTYSPNVIFQSATPAPTTGNNVWDLGNLSNGTVTIINVTVLVVGLSNGTVINNTANITAVNATGGVIAQSDFEETTVTSNILNSNITNSTIQNSTKINVNMINSSNFGCVVGNSNETNTNCTNSNINNSQVTNSNITNSTITNSTTDNSALTNSTSTNSTKTTSTVINSSNTNCTVTNSLENNTICVDSTLSGSTKVDSTINLSTNTGCTVTRTTEFNVSCTGSTFTDSIKINSTITASVNTNCTVANSVEASTTCTNSNIDNSTVTSSIVTDSNVTNSNKDTTTMINASIQGSTNVGCVIENTVEIGSTCTGATFNNSIIINATIPGGIWNNATIIGDNCTAGTVTVGGVTTPCPLLLSVFFKVPVASGGGGGGATRAAGTGGGGISVAVARGLVKDTKTLTTAPLRRQDVVRLKVKGLTHTLTVQEVQRDSVTVVIASEPQTVTIKRGKYVNVDVDHDGTNDIRVQVMTLQPPTTILQISDLVQPQKTLFNIPPKKITLQKQKPAKIEQSKPQKPKAKTTITPKTQTNKFKQYLELGKERAKTYYSKAKIAIFSVSKKTYQTSVYGLLALVVLLLLVKVVRRPSNKITTGTRAIKKVKITKPVKQTKVSKVKSKKTRVDKTIARAEKNLSEIESLLKKYK